MATKRPELAQSELVAELPAACASEAAAVEFLEGKRWGETPHCPECESADVYKMTDRATGERNKRFLWRCRHCNRQFSVRTGTVYEESLIPLQKWCRALWECASAKNGCSALELSRRIQVSYKTALFVMHRIRHAMADFPPPDDKLSGTVEIDETYVGGKPRYRRPKEGNRRSWYKKNPGGGAGKIPVVAVVQRGGNVRTRVMANVNSRNLAKVLRDNVAPGTQVYTDEFNAYKAACRAPGLPHKSVRHSHGEYVLPENPDVHTNTIEGFFSRVKRGLNGTYHAVSKEHLHRYLDHFAYTYNTRRLNDGERTLDLIRRTDGRRLMYRDPREKPTPPADPQLPPFPDAAA